MIGITVAIGEKYKKLAANASFLFQKMTGLDFKIITEDDNISEYEKKFPYLIKSRLFDFTSEDTILYFDADLMYIRPWDPRKFADGNFYCVRDKIYNWQARVESEYYGLDPIRYFNSGFFIANRFNHQEYFKKVYELCIYLNNIRENINSSPQDLDTWRFKMVTPTYDQGIFNLVAQKSGLPIHFLNKKYNWLNENMSQESLFLYINSLSIHYCAKKDLNYVNDHLLNLIKICHNFDSLIVWDDNLTEKAVGKYLYQCREHGWSKEVTLLEDGTILSKEGLQWEQLYCFDAISNQLLFIGQKYEDTIDKKILTVSANFKYNEPNWVGKFSKNRFENSPKLELIKIK